MSRTIAATFALLSCVAGHIAAQQPAPTATPVRSVTLSLAEYNRLIDLANRGAETGIPPPVAAVVASADLRIRVDRDAARGTFTLNGEVLRSGISRVSLLSGATLIDVNAGGQPVALVADGRAHSALVPGPGPFELTLEWGTPLTFTPGRASFVLPVPQAGAAQMTIDVPGEQADLRLSAGLITRRSVANGRTLVEVTLDPGAPTEVSWSIGDTTQAATLREVRALADVMTMITIGDSDLRMVALVDVTVVQGDLRSLLVRLPSGYELTGVSGSSLEASEARDGALVLSIASPSARSHQFLIGLERAHEGGSFAFDTGLVSVDGIQRERGEIAIEGVGTLELTAAEREGLHRIDMRELNKALGSLARLPVLAAFRYQRTTIAPPSLALEVKRFADVGVLAAIAERAVATTLITSEGRALTEVALEIRNRAQPFLKVTLPAGASMVSVEVAGESAKPVSGADGTRVPLLRPGLRPNGSYRVSFVYLHAGTPFAKKGDLRMTLPRMDVPVGIVEWEVFVPGKYDTRAVDGNAIDRRMLPPGLVAERPETVGSVEATPVARMDVAGGAEVGVDSGAGAGIKSQLPLAHNLSQPSADRERDEVVARKSQEAAQPSENVMNLQRRTAGVLPIRVDVPRAGISHRFVRPLVVDQETMVTLRYRRR